MEKYSFFDAVADDNGAYDRIYKSEDIAAYFASFIGNGVYPNPANNLQVVAAGDGMKVTIKAGKAWLNGYFYQLDADLTKQLVNADGSFGRIDTIVIRLDYLERKITAEIKQGATAISPVAAALQRDSDIWEIALAYITVAKGVVSVTDIDISDKRSNNSLCGYVSGVVNQIDTTNLFLQYNTAFTTWFDAMKGQLTTDAAGNLQTEIDAINAGTTTMLKSIYDTDNNGVVDNSKKLDGHATEYFATASALDTNVGQLQTAITNLDNSVGNWVDISSSCSLSYINSCFIWVNTNRREVRISLVVAPGCPNQRVIAVIPSAYVPSWLSGYTSYHGLRIGTTNDPNGFSVDHVLNGYGQIVSSHSSAGDTSIPMMVYFNYKY